MTLYEIVNKLIGQVKPIGETESDNKSFDNLHQMLELIEQLMKDVADVSSFAKRTEYSMQRSGKLAEKFMEYIKEEFFSNDIKKNSPE